MFPPNTQILIVDDMPTMRRVITKSLHSMGYKNIKEANNGEEAWKALNHSEPAVDLIISDLNMPTVNGIELLKKVRTDQRFKKLPFILLTIESEPEHIKEALAHGVTDYILKPFDERMFSQKLESAHKRQSSKKV